MAEQFTAVKNNIFPYEREKKTPRFSLKREAAEQKPKEKKNQGSGISHLVTGFIGEKQKSGKKESVRKFFLSITIPVLILLFWEIGVRQGWINGNVIPAPSRLWVTFVDLVTSGRLGQGLLISFRRVLIGFLIASVIGIVLGFLMGIFASFNTLLSSVINVLRPIPSIALVPIFIIVLGVGEAANISIIIFGAIWPILLNTTAGVMNVDRKLMELAYVYRLRSSKVLFRIIFPSALYSILTGLRLGVSGAWMSVVAAEMIGATSGIGFMITFAKSLAQAANMYVLVLVIGVIGYVLDRLLLAVQHWAGRKFCGNVTG